MAQTTLSIRIDENLKKQLEYLCSEFGMNITTAFTVFAKAVIKENRIPFEISADPFYSGANYRHIMKGIHAVESGEPGVVKTMEELEAMADE